MLNDQLDVSLQIKSRLMSEGFEVCGITSPDSIKKSKSALREFLANDWHGSMEWMAANEERRADPRVIWPEARSIIVVGMNYGPDIDPLNSLNKTSCGGISVYAQGKDYHEVLKKRLKSVGRWMHEKLGADVKIFVDTAPVMEKPLAAAAGIGWQGKHTNLVSQDFGSWLFIGSIFTTLDLNYTDPHQDLCGSCTACLDICPTNAFPSPYKLDARKCISYLTIEHKGHIPSEFRSPIGNRIYGCDDCLAVCPWNKFARKAKEIAFHSKEALKSAKLKSLALLDDGAFRRMFAGTAVKRISRDRFVRNVLIAIGNSRDPSLLETAEGLLEDPSPLVRAMAVWACSRLGSMNRVSELKQAYIHSESDSAVLSEWETCPSRANAAG